MNRPYIICHMVTSLDGKVTGNFLYQPQCEKATDLYYQINRDYKADGFACGRVTMEGSFTGGWYPDLSEFEPAYIPTDYLVDDVANPADALCALMLVLAIDAEKCSRND